MSSTNPEIDPYLEDFADKLSYSFAAIAVSSLAGYFWIKHNVQYVAPFSIAAGMKSSESWQKAWGAWDVYKENKVIDT